MTLKKPEILNKDHDLMGFNSNYPELDEWLKKYAFQAKMSGSANIFIVTDKNLVVGFYSLTVGQVDIGEASERIKKGMGKYPIPVVILARLAVHHTYQGRSIGKGMLKDAILKTLQIAEQGGVRALLVHAIDEKANAFYKRFGFEPSPIRENQLLLLLKDAKKLISE
ncbi:GNAT family N-acetyltransferase [Legionella quinlivanii]|uniref:GNAT family N-acetyltransferase n=1 Tax=Legionella quinlivanii TaxID=45073 RepID=A0A364LKK7_9GAMM|nr:GNAT family N-acetyltransferase [Legionella quinlivanii]RAP37109.1 GNAT family N-acetyltransferase [Legionella quinlivanii]